MFRYTCLNALACPEIRDTPPKPLKVQGTCIKSCTVAHGLYSHPLISHPLMVPFSERHKVTDQHIYNLAWSFVKAEVQNWLALEDWMKILGPTR